MSLTFTPEGYKRARRILLPFASDDIVRPNLYGIIVAGVALAATNGHVLRVIPTATCGTLDVAAERFVITRNRLTNDAALAFDRDRNIGDPPAFEQVIPQRSARTVRADRKRLLAAVRDALVPARAAHDARWKEWRVGFDQSKAAKAIANGRLLAAFEAEKKRFEALHVEEMRDWEAAAKAAKAAKTKPPRKPAKVKPPRPALDTRPYPFPEPSALAYVGLVCQQDRVSLVVARFVLNANNKPAYEEVSRTVLDAGTAHVTDGASPVAENVTFNAPYLLAALRGFEESELRIGLSGELDPMVVSPWGAALAARDLAVVMPVRT